MRHLRSLKMHTRFSRRCFRAETLYSHPNGGPSVKSHCSVLGALQLCVAQPHSSLHPERRPDRLHALNSPRFMSESQRRAQKPFISEQRTLMLLVACDGVLYPRSAASTRRQPGRCPECRGVVCTCWPLKQCLGEALMVLRASLLHIV